MQIAHYREQKQRDNAKNIPGLSILMEIAERKPACTLNDAVQRIVFTLARTSIARKGLTDRNILSAAFRLAVYKYYWIREPEDYVPATHNPSRIFIGLFEWLFVRYRCPAFYLNELIDRSPDLKHMTRTWVNRIMADENDILRSIIRISQGASVRSCYMPGRLSAAGAHHFSVAPGDLGYREAIRWAQVRAAKGSEELARTILNSRIGNNFSDDDFWITVIEFFSRQNLIEMSQVSVIIDYIHRLKFVKDLQSDGSERITQPDFQLKGRTMQSLLAGAMRWHSELNRSAAAKRKAWKSCGIPTYYADSKNFEYTIVELLDTKDLRQEGMTLSHCVITYAPQCARGVSAVFSLRKQEKVNYSAMVQRILTIEIRLPRDVVQARGKHNSPPTPEAENLLKAFAIKNGLNRRA